MGIKTNNILIAEFMGVKFNNPGKYTCMCDEYHTCDGCQEETEYVDQGNYHKSWEWLIPVVEKIFSIKEPDGGDYRFVDLLEDINSALE